MIIVRQFNIYGGIEYDALQTVLEITNANSFSGIKSQDSSKKSLHHAFLLRGKIPIPLSALQARSLNFQKHTDFHKISTHVCVDCGADHNSEGLRYQRVDINSANPLLATEYLQSYPFPPPPPPSDNAALHPHPAADFKKLISIPSLLHSIPRPTSLARDASTPVMGPGIYFAVALVMVHLLPPAYLSSRLRLKVIYTLLCAMGGWLALWSYQRWKQRDAVCDDVAAHEAGHLLL